MATLTIRNLPKDLVERLKAAAARNKRSMEQEVRELLHQHYLRREDIFDRIRNRPKNFPSATAREIQKWIETGRR